MIRYIPEKTTLYKPVGCKECANTGYRGRFAITEILVMTAELEGLIGAGATADKIAVAARSQGMRSLFESALKHLIKGHTSVEELLRVTDIPHEHMRDAVGHPSQAKPLGKVAGGDAAAPASAPGEPAFELIDEPLDLGEGTDGKGMILLVEDEDQLRRVMKDLLEREGYAIVEAADGVQALEQVDRHNPDVILLDLNLPGMDGYAVLQHLRSRPGTLQRPGHRAHRQGR